MPHPLLSQILPILQVVQDDKEKLEQILIFLKAEILPQIESEHIEVVIPEKYEALVHTIADSLTAGMLCFLNMETLEVEDIPKSYLDEYDEEMAEEFGEEEGVFELKHLQWEHKCCFEPLPSSESFRIMENFTERVGDQKVQQILIGILNRKKPFANFNNFIHNSDYREDWFAFRLDAYKTHVREEIYLELKRKNEE
ncbi:UPF0158 family protein [Niabella ginsengisoli]|uniref:UPF0158 family protein n=1 Tax=Niabella ginsengisoli TaxID=522298 RepID=A0ABS9SI42_9BACT|nr:UPF0158 family protein [Niabella ginsengisoli]MCH5598032.1 UPF0158 family protein [Niabella ginsengisoli]